MLAGLANYTFYPVTAGGLCVTIGLKCLRREVSPVRFGGPKVTVACVLTSSTLVQGGGRGLRDAGLQHVGLHGPGSLCAPDRRASPPAKLPAQKGPGRLSWSRRPGGEAMGC